MSEWKHQLPFRPMLPGAPSARRLFLGLLLLLSISLLDAQTSVPKAARKTVLILGDSLAAGYGVEADEGFPALLQQKIDAQGWVFKIFNAGVSGDTTAGGLRRIDWLLRQRIDVLLLELGGNDGLRGLPPATTRTNLQAIINRVRSKHPQAEIVVAGMRMPPSMGREYAEAFQNVFQEIAKANQAALIPFLLEGVGGKPALNLPDGIHPTPDGHKIIADTVWKTLRPVLERLHAGATN